MTYNDFLEEERKEEMFILMNTLIGSNIQHSVFEHYIKKAERVIKNYSCIDEITPDLDDVVVELAVYFFKNRNNAGIVHQTQGSRSQTIIDGIPDSIKATLPIPRIRVV